MDKKPHEDKNAGKGAEDKGGEQPKPDPDQAAKDAAHEQEVEALKARIGELESETEELRAYKEAREARDEAQRRADQQRGLQIRERRQPETGGRIKPGKRLYLTADKSRLVPEGHKDAATLYCTEHKSVPRAEFERLTGR